MGEVKRASQAPPPRPAHRTHHPARCFTTMSSSVGLDVHPTNETSGNISSLLKRKLRLREYQKCTQGAQLVSRGAGVCIQVCGSLKYHSVSPPINQFPWAFMNVMKHELLVKQRVSCIHLFSHCPAQCLLDSEVVLQKCLWK